MAHSLGTQGKCQQPTMSKMSLKSQFGDLPGGPVASSHSQCLGSIPGQGTRSHMLQLKPGAAKQINTYFFKKIKPQKFLKNVSALT